MSLTAEDIQASQVVADVESTDRNNRSNDGSSGQPVRRTSYHRVHFRRDGHAAVRRQLHRTVLPGRSALELHRLPPLVHDRVPRAVRRVDRVHVGLHALLRRHLYPVLSTYDDHRQSRGKYTIHHTVPRATARNQK